MGFHERLLGFNGDGSKIRQQKKNRRGPAVGWGVQSVVAFRPLDRQWGVRRKNKQSEKALNSWIGM
jgi:hypothetical protein